MITNFQRKVYKVTQGVPRGEVITYKAVARLVGKPKAIRAVGNALNRNRDPRIPCHRVVRSDGKIGGYNRGIPAKMKLLRQEGVVVTGYRAASTTFLKTAG